MRLRPSVKLSAAFLFYLLIALMVVVFSQKTGILTYPVIILASLLFILALRLKVPLDGFITGMAVAAVSMGTIIALEILPGAIRIESLSDNFVLIMIAGVIIQLFVGFGEELSFRASIFQGLYDELGIWPAAILSAAGFAVMHIPSMEGLGIGELSGLIALGTIFLAGIALALLYAYGGLFNAVAFHVTWNFIEYGLFQMVDPLYGAIVVSKPGPVLLTGGAFGVEASVIALAVTALLVPSLWLYYSRARKTPGEKST